MNPRRPSNRHLGDIARAIGNLIWTTIIVVGSPLALTRFFGYPLPREMPDWAEVVTTPMQLVEPSVVINALVCIGWLAWVIVVAYVLVDLVDLARGVGNRARRFGPASVIAGKLVASIALLLSLLRAQPSTAPNTSRPAVAVHVVDGTNYAATATLNLTLAGSTRLNLPEQAPPAPATQATRTYVVKRGDSLWRIAEQQLGDGFRWREIYDLNQDTITNPDLICTGWRLTLPGGSDVAVPPSEEPAGASASPAAASPLPEEEAPTAALVPLPEVAPAPVQPMSSNAPTATAPDPTPSTAPPVESTPVPPPTATSAPVSQAETIPVASLEGVATPDPVPGTGTSLPLALRAQGFETQEQYQEWLAQQTDAARGASPTGEGSHSTEPAHLVAALAIPALLAAGVVTAVDRRRRRVLQHRPIHAPLPRRRPELRPVEMAYRTQALADPREQIEWVDAVLRLLTAEMTAHPEEAQLLLVRPGAYGLELLWDRCPTTPCPSGFQLAGDNHTWEYRLEDRAALDALRERVGAQPPYVQALATLGESREGPVLINLEAVDELDLYGDADAIDGWVAAVSLDLAAHRWAERVAKAISLPSPTTPRLTTTLRITDDGRATPLVWQAQRAQTGAPWKYSLLAEQAVLSNDELGFSIEVAPAFVSPELLAMTEQLLDDASQDPYRGDDQDAHLDGGSPGVPETPAGESMTSVNQSDAGSMPHAADAALGTDTAPESPSRTTLVLHREPRDEISSEWDVSTGLVVRVLGPVRTSGWLTPPKSARTEALLVFLAMCRPATASTERIIDALWNGKAVTPKSVYNAVTNLRREAGDSSVVTSSPDGYALDEQVVTDWDRFVRLVEQARGEAWGDRRESLAAALSMVHGKPFDGAEREYPWAATDGAISRLEVAVTDAAAQLAAEAIEQGDCAMAIWAARRALLACPWLVRMYGFIIEAHALEGDVTAIEHTWRELQRSLGEDDVPAELVELYALHRT